MYIPQDPPLVLHLPTSWWPVCSRSCPHILLWGWRDSNLCSQNICEPDALPTELNRDRQAQYTLYFHILLIRKRPFHPKHVFSPQFLADKVLLRGHSYPYFLFGFEARMGSLIHTLWQRYTLITFPEIHLWCYSCLLLDSQLVYSPVTPQAVASRGYVTMTWVLTSERFTDWAIRAGSPDTNIWQNVLYLSNTILKVLFYSFYRHPLQTAACFGGGRSEHCAVKNHPSLPGKKTW